MADRLFNTPRRDYPMSDSSSASQALQFLFRQGQLVVVVDANPAIQHMTGDGVRLFQRVHAVGAALILVQLGILA